MHDCNVEKILTEKLLVNFTIVFTKKQQENVELNIKFWCRKAEIVFLVKYILMLFLFTTTVHIFIMI